MFLQERCVVTVSGAQFRHDMQVYEKKSSMLQRRIENQVVQVVLADDEVVLAVGAGVGSLGHGAHSLTPCSAEWGH
jgi:hypothetical protein